MKKCVEKCMTLKVSCPNQECRMWIDSEKNLNCCNVAIDNNGEMDLRQIGEILGISFVRVKQIQDKAIQKISPHLKVIQ